MIFYTEPARTKNLRKHLAESYVYSCNTYTGVSKIPLIICRGGIELRSIGRRNVEGNRRFWNKSCHVRKKASDN